MTDIASRAAELAAAGWRIFPLRPGTKLPAIAKWQQVATDDAVTVRGWWQRWATANIGLLTGHRGTLVLDVDCKNGSLGFDSLRSLESKHGALPPTLTAVTASGGRHHYFSSSVATRNSASAIGAGLDIRGAGGFVVAPGSILADGRAYEWIKPIQPIATAPNWLLQLIVAAAPRATVAETAPPSTTEADAVLLADLSAALEYVSSDNRSDWIAIGAALRCLGEDGRVLWLAWSEKSPKHDAARDPDVWDTIGHDSTGYPAVFAKAQALGWINPRALDLSTVGFGQLPLPTSDALRIVDVSSIETATIRPPRFIVERIVPAGHVTLLGGHGGAGKSVTALALAAHVAAGVNWAGLAVQREPVLFLSLEDSGELVRFRLRKVIGACGLDANAVTTHLRIVDGTTAGPLMSEHLGARQLMPTPALAAVRALVTDAQLIVVDNASDAFDGNENSRQHVRTFIRALAELGRGNDAGVLLLAHIDKNAAKFGSQGNTYSGSSAWHNSARSRLALIHERNGIELRHEKSNLGPMIQPIRMGWTQDGVLVPLLGVASEPADDDAAAVLAAIEAAMRDGVDVPTARSGPVTAAHVLENLPDLPPRLRGSQGREQFWNAIAELQRSGRLTIEDYRNAQRKLKQRFAPMRQFAPVPVTGANPEQAHGDCANAPVPVAGGVGVSGAHQTGAKGVE